MPPFCGCIGVTNNFSYHVIARADRPVAISWYHLSIRCAGTDIAPGDSHVGALPLLGMTELMVRQFNEYKNARMLWHPGESYVWKNYSLE